VGVFTQSTQYTQRLNIQKLYQGPGDVFSGAWSWGGFRAYSYATLGTNAVRLRRDSDNSEQDFASQAPGGGLDASALSSFKGAANLFLVKAYDQTGNGRDWTQATAANQCPVTLSSLNGQPTASWSCSTTPIFRLVNSSSIATITMPISYSVVANVGTARASTIMWIGGSTQLSSALAAFRYGLYNGSSFSVNATSGVWTSLQAVFSATAANGALYINGSGTTGNTGNTDLKNGNPVALGDNVNPSTGADFSAAEFGVWMAEMTSGQAASMSSNIRSYWGF